MRLFSITSLFLISTLFVHSQETELDARQAVYDAWKGLYEAYEVQDLDKMLTYYEDDVIRMFTNGVPVEGKETFRETWTEMMENNVVIMNDYSEPTILMAEDHVVTYNTYDETFTSRDTGESRKVIGTWMAVWKKQPNGTWKTRLTTWHTRN